MSWPRERKSPAGGRGSETHTVRGEFQQTVYSEAGEIATAVKAEADLPDFEAGWLWYYEHGNPRPHPVAFLRPWHEGWYDLHHFDNWVDAISCAVSLTSTRPNCAYVGGPGA